MFVQQLELSAESQFENVMKTHLKNVRRFVFLMVKNHSLAEDITQDVFLKVYQNMGSFRQESAIKTWIYKIAINEVKMNLRSRWLRRIVLLEKIGEVIGGAAVSNELKNLENEDLLKSVLSLSTSYRKVIVLHFFEDLTIEEIANVLDCSPNAVYTKLHRAKKKLKERLNKEEHIWN